ncbi:MAG: ion channel, partial [Flavobacteriaceae bacterium]|nr:ion channel [Flavobacteriaceae bacterium]
MQNNILYRIKLLLNLIKELIFLVVLLSLFFLIMNIWGHFEYPNLWAGALVIFSITKIYFLVSHTFKKLDILIENNHSFKHMLFLLGAIITLIITSFAIDYFCVSEIYTNAFSGIENGQPSKYRFFDLLYFSIVTFTTVGYGDI